MLVAGICGGHDANWCFFEDGKMIGAFEKERFSRIRHDGGRVIEYMEQTLHRLGHEMTDIDLIATTEHVHIGTESGLELLGKKCYEKPDEWITQTAVIKGKRIPVISVPHHLCHAAYCYYSSQKDEMTVITWDGGGDFYTIDAYTSSSISIWKNGKLVNLDRIGNCDIGSLWYIYSQQIFGDGNAAGKLMGLAAKGDDFLVDKMREYCRKPVRGGLKDTFGIKNCWPEEDLPLFNTYNDWKMKETQNLAAAIQKVTTEVGIGMANAAYQQTGIKNFGLSGGVALNGYMNTAIATAVPFQSVHVPPSVHDGGLSMGAALFALNHVMGIRNVPMTDSDLVYTGIQYTEQEVVAALHSSALSVDKLTDKEAVDAAADDIIAGKVIGWFEGRSEHGPRALGHRSILASPTFENMRERLNSTIKFREEFRPIAPVVLEEDIEFCTKDIKRSPFMMHIVETTPEYQAKCPSGIHLDGTARIQTVKEDNPMGRILASMKGKHAVPSVLNTSFNVKSPIVETPAEAIETFSKVPFDVMYLEGYRITKK